MGQPGWGQGVGVARGLGVVFEVVVVEGGGLSRPRRRRPRRRNPRRARAESGGRTPRRSASAGAAFAVAHAVRHLFARSASGGGHHIAARWLAGTAPEGLAAHGDGFGFFVGFGHELGEDLHRNLLLGELLDRHHEAFFV